MNGPCKVWSAVDDTLVEGRMVLNARLGGCPKWYLGPCPRINMRIPEEIYKSVVFVGSRTAGHDAAHERRAGRIADVEDLQLHGAVVGDVEEIAVEEHLVDEVLGPAPRNYLPNASRTACLVS